jgi:uncharacterized protein (TIGR04255 family)
LLKPHAAGELNSDLSDSVVHVARELVLKLDAHDSKVRVIHGFETSPDGEVCYVIDCDFFTEREIEVANARAVLDHFNQQAGNLFRWFLEPRLIAAMEPSAL